MHQPLISKHKCFTLTRTGQISTSCKTLIHRENRFLIRSLIYSLLNFRIWLKKKNPPRNKQFETTEFFKVHH